MLLGWCWCSNKVQQRDRSLTLASPLPPPSPARRSLVTSIEVSAPPDRVWAVLTDFPSYPTWNPFIKRFEGELKVGGRVKMFAQPPGEKGMEFKPLLLKGELPVSARLCVRE